MKNTGFIVSMALLLAAPVASTSAQTVAAAAPDSGLVLVVEVGSRLYPDWHEVQRLQLQQSFYLGDSEFTARVEDFVPDFRIIDKKIVNMSQELENPAAQIIVYHDTTATDSTWAFLNFPPHFSPQAFFTFQLKEIHGYQKGSVPVWIPATSPARPDEPATTSQDSSLAAPKDGTHG